jgi:hypothetical protein
VRLAQAPPRDALIEELLGMLAHLGFLERRDRCKTIAWRHA